jgi:hemoglobin
MAPTVSPRNVIALTVRLAHARRHSHSATDSLHFSFDFMSLEDQQPSDPTAPTPYEAMGGEDRVRILTDRFYDLMDLEPAYAELRAAHGSDLASARQKLFWFLCGWLGGPDHYQMRFGHPRLRMRHLPFSIGVKERDQWVACMDQAMGETQIPPQLRARLRESFMGTADWMRNRSV